MMKLKFEKMPKKRPLLLLGITFICFQIVIFKDYLSFLSSKIIVSNQWCTCPNVKVISGQIYLKSITPNDLKRYNLNFTEMFVKNDISTNSDPMGINQYIIEGKIIGVKKDSKKYYPIFKIEKYKDAIIFTFFRWIISIIIILEIFFLIYKAKPILKRNTL